MNRLMVGPDYEQLRDTLTHVEHGQTLRFETDERRRAAADPVERPQAEALPQLRQRPPRHGRPARAPARRTASPPTRSRRSTSAPPSPISTTSCTRDPRTRCRPNSASNMPSPASLVTGNCTLADFTDEAAARAELRALYPRIHRHPVDKAEGEFPTEVEVVLKDGRRFETAVPWPAGSLAAPFTARPALGQVRRLHRRPARRRARRRPARRARGPARPPLHCAARWPRSTTPAP